MIRLPKFDVVTPLSLKEALEILSDNSGEIKILAGGTDLLVGIKRELFRPNKVLSLGRINELRQIKFSLQDGLQIGAMCTLDEIERNKDVKQYYPSIVQTVRSIASPQIRNTATIGGNLCLNTRCMYYDQSEFWRGSLGFCLKHGNGVCHVAPELSRCTAVFCSDLAPLLIALDSTIELLSFDSQRNILLSELYTDDGAHPLELKSSEVLSQIKIPYNPSTKSIHAKLRNRGSIDFPLLNIGAALTFSDSNICTRAKVVVVAVASSPVIIEEASRHLAGNKITSDLVDKVSTSVLESIHPMPNIDGSVNYRKKMVQYLIGKILNEFMARISDISY